MLAVGTRWPNQCLMMPESVVAERTPLGAICGPFGPPIRAIGCFAGERQSALPQAQTSLPARSTRRPDRHHGEAVPGQRERGAEGAHRSHPG